jgi:iron complex transport system substrate-binding protein
MRVASLLPSATEICYALGVEPVGVSHECDWPPAAADKPALNRSRIDPDADSERINEQVVRAEQDHGSVYEIDLAALERTDPDLIVTQGVCDVCAVDTVLVEEAIERADVEAAVLTTDPHSLGDLYADVERIGDAVGLPERAADLVASLEARVEAVAERTRDLDPADRPTVAVLDWLDPVMIAGHWTPELVGLAGGRYGMADPGERSRPREWRAVREYDPDVLVAAPCGFELDRTVAERDALADRPGWADLAAVGADRAWAMDGHHYVNRPGPRLVETLEHLAGLLHPDRFDAPPDDVARPLSAPVSAEGPRL